MKGEINLYQVDKSYAKEIYKQIKLDILNLKIKDGDFLTLAELAEKYNVSKTPVRDALGTLEIQGYLKSLPRKGYLVKPVTQRNIRESFQMRSILERAAVNLAVKIASDSELESILQLAMKFPDGSQSSEIAQFNELNDMFHMLIIKATHNSLLIETCEGIMENLSRILLMDCKNLEFAKEKDDHINIAKSLIERDSKKAEEQIVKHISRLEARFYTNWNSHSIRIKIWGKLINKVRILNYIWIKIYDDLRIHITYKEDFLVYKKYKLRHKVLKAYVAILKLFKGEQTMNKKSLVGILLASVMSVGIMSGCGAAKNDSSKSSDGNKKYIIACDSKYAPFSFEENGKYKGIDVELLDAIAKEEKIEYELKPMDFDGIIPGLTSNQLDGAIAGMSITDERKKSLDFSDGYFVSGLSLVVNKDNTEINGESDLNGKSASIKKGQQEQNLQKIMNLNMDWN